MHANLQHKEINAVAGILRRSGYSVDEHTRLVIVQDPVHSAIKGRLFLTGHDPIKISTERQARAFINARS